VKLTSFAVVCCAQARKNAGIGARAKVEILAAEQDMYVSRTTGKDTVQSGCKGMGTSRRSWSLQHLANYLEKHSAGSVAAAFSQNMNLEPVVLAVNRCDVGLTGHAVVSCVW
jgi:hypothetical protein